MTTARRRTRAEQQAETRRRIVEAAAEEFAAHGFEGASIDAITERAGFTRGAFYSNFSSKSDLLVELSQAKMSSFEADALPDLLAVDLDTRLDRAASWILEQPAPDELLLLVELGRVRERAPEAEATIARFLDEAETFVERVLTAAVPDHSSRPGEQRHQIATAMLAILTGVQLLRHLGVDVEHDTVRVLLRGALVDDLDA
jgi:AcrR family transcriptional regulator